jgi:hypothetical protein
MGRLCCKSRFSLVLKNFSGHTTLTEVARYTKAADQERMARDGMAAIISRTGSGNGV